MIPTVAVAQVLRRHTRTRTDSIPQPNGPRLTRHHCACGQVTFDHDLHRAQAIVDHLVTSAVDRLADALDDPDDCPGYPECADCTFGDPDRARDLAVADRLETP